LERRAGLDFVAAFWGFVCAKEGETGVGDYTSGYYFTSLVGTFRWVAHYAGDANNNAVDTHCNDANESSTVNKATPTLTTTASGPVVVGQNIHDVAHLSGGYGILAGSVTFDVFAPGDTTCSTPIAVPPAAAVSGAGDYTSGNYTTSAVGDYRWTAHYLGDAKNIAVDTHCNDANESSTAVTASPAVGGIAELPNRSGSSGLNYMALAGLAAAALLTLSAGAWYARSRWLR